MNTGRSFSEIGSQNCKKYDIIDGLFLCYSIFSFGHISVLLLYIMHDPHMHDLQFPILLLTRIGEVLEI